MTTIRIYQFDKPVPNSGITPHSGINVAYTVTDEKHLVLAPQSSPPSERGRILRAVDRLENMKPGMKYIISSHDIVRDTNTFQLGDRVYSGEKMYDYEIGDMRTATWLIEQDNITKLNQHTAQVVDVKELNYKTLMEYTLDKSNGPLHRPIVQLRDRARLSNEKNAQEKLAEIEAKVRQEFQELASLEAKLLDDMAKHFLKV
ncbi:hypothetical protein J4437_03390 [Candidatus Woesearchaeota archaeon]|nr:hypothetical protein [Candidatus Woesearchaeota archaeon]